MRGVSSGRVDKSTPVTGILLHEIASSSNIEWIYCQALFEICTGSAKAKSTKCAMISSHSCLDFLSVINCESLLRLVEGARCVALSSFSLAFTLAATVSLSLSQVELHLDDAR